MSDVGGEAEALHNDWCWSFCVPEPLAGLKYGDCDCPCHQPTETGAPGHYFPPTSNPGIYCCTFCGLVTNRRLNERCPSRTTQPGTTP